MQCAWIKIDTQRLTLRLWRKHAKWLDVFELRLWLKNVGCEWVGGQWYACVNGLGDLEKDEILQIQQRTIEDGITYVENEPPASDTP